MFGVLVEIDLMESNLAMWIDRGECAIQVILIETMIMIKETTNAQRCLATQQQT